MNNIKQGHLKDDKQYLVSANKFETRKRPINKIGWQSKRTGAKNSNVQ